MNQNTLKKLTPEQAHLYRTQAPHLNDQSDAYASGMHNYPNSIQIDIVVVESTKLATRTLTCR